MRIDGIWRDGALEATQATPAEAPSLESLLPTPEVPCEDPPGGWDDTGVDAEAEILALQDEVSRNPDTYVGVWAAAPKDDPEGTRRVIVVGTVADVEAVGARLRSILPHDLCVVRVEYSYEQFEHVQRHLSEEGSNWELTIDPAVDRVVARVPVLDLATAEAVAPYADFVTVRPIVVRVDA